MKEGKQEEREERTEEGNAKGKQASQRTICTNKKHISFPELV